MCPRAVAKLGARVWGLHAVERLFPHQHVLPSIGFPMMTTQNVLAGPNLVFGPARYSPDEDYDDFVQVPVHVPGQTNPVCHLERVDGHGPWVVNCGFCDPTPEIAALHERDLCSWSLADAKDLLRNLLSGQDPPLCPRSQDRGKSLGCVCTCGLQTYA